MSSVSTMRGRLLVTTPSSRRILGCWNWPSNAAWPRKVICRLSAPPVHRAWMATACSRRPRGCSRPLRTSPKEPGGQAQAGVGGGQGRAVGSQHPAAFTRNAARPSLCPDNTCPNDLLNLDISRVHLPGKFSDGLAGVLVCGWVDVILHPKPCRCVVCIRRVWCKAGLPTNHRHVPLTCKDGAKELPSILGEPSLAWCAPGPSPQLLSVHPPPHPHPPHLGCCTVAVAPCSLSYAAS